MIKEITGCINCPACDMLDMAPGYSCRLKEKDENEKYIYIKEDKNYLPHTPDWCPLKKEAITLQFIQ